MVDKAIIPECYIDTGLIETLLPTKVGYNHQKGCNNVVIEMTTSNGLKDGFALGIVDKDKRQLNYLAECEIIDSVPGSLLLWKHKEKHHYIIQICPEAEQWIIGLAKELGIVISNYNLPEDLREFCKASKKLTDSDDKRFIGLFSEMRSRGSENIKIRKLVRWITVLKEKTFFATIPELIS